MEGGERGAAQAGGARGAFIVQIADALEEARSYRKNRSAYDQNRVHPFDLGRADLEAMGPVVEGRAPLLIEVHRASDIRQIIAFAREHLAGYKVPRSISFMDDIPRTGSGKILKRDLRKPFWAGRKSRV
jgi:acyl-CoA synthetase (AMP-forming)/AMP-acid ligase II